MPQEWQFHISTDIIVVKNGNFTFLLTSSGQECQFHMSTDILRSRMSISYYLLTYSGQGWQFHMYYWHIVLMNGNFILLMKCNGQEWQLSHWLLTCSGQECQFHIATDILWSRMAISHFYWHLVVKNDNFTCFFWHLSGQEWQFHISNDM